MGDKVSAADRGNIEAALNQLKSVKDGDDVEAIKKALEALQQSSHKLAEAMYASGQAEAAADGDAAGSATGGGDDVVDADFEEVKDDKK
jgi:molecular chaperone DnaK